MMILKLCNGPVMKALIFGLVISLSLLCLPALSYEPLDDLLARSALGPVEIQDGLIVGSTSEGESGYIADSVDEKLLSASKASSSNEVAKRGFGFPGGSQVEEVKKSENEGSVSKPVTSSAEVSVSSTNDYSAESGKKDVPNTQTIDTIKQDGSQGGDNKQVSSQSPTQARGFGDIFKGISNQGAANAQPEISSNGQPANPDFVVSKENLPTIIEKNQAIEPGTQIALGVDDQNISKFSGNSSSSGLPMSSARTFDSWTNCVGSQSNKYGTCKNDVDCEKHKGRADGSCMGGLGVCCVMALSCNDKSFENNTFFANPDFPEPSWEARQCQVELVKKGLHVVQVMIEFDEFELAPPNIDGECITDVFQIRLASGKPSPYSQLRFCGQNTGQHLYLDVSQVDEPLVLSIATSGGGFPRRWSIRIVQMDSKNQLLAPPGCLQYYTDTVGHFRSFNLGRNLKNLYYAICFRIDNGYSGLRFTSNFFGMNGPFCRKRIGKTQSRPGFLLNGTNFFAHPHHLVIPPPGAAIPPPRPAYLQTITQAPIIQQQPQIYQQLPQVQFQQQGIGKAGFKFKRSVQQQSQNVGLGANPTGQSTSSPQGPVNEPLQSSSGSRTFGNLGFNLFGSSDKEAKLDTKEFEKQEQYKPTAYPYHPPPPVFVPSYTQQPIIFGGEPGKGGLGGENTFVIGKDHEFSHSKHHESFGWKAKEELKYSEKFGPGYAGHHNKFPHQQPYLIGHQRPHGPYPVDYHHKEIGKFGEKYEFLHEKQEKNHHGKDEKGSSWWPSFGFMSSRKDDKKDKEKFFMHHEALFPLIRLPEMPHCEPRYCGANDEITFPPSGDSIAEMCGNLFNRGRGPKIISGSPLVVYVSNRGIQRGAGFDMNYEQVFYIPKPY